MSVPNQSVLTIVKPRAVCPPFVQVNQDDWQTAFKNLPPAAFAVYLYLAQNANGYKFEFSPQAIANTGLMAKGTASKARAALEMAGYIVDGCFYTESPEKRRLKDDMNKEKILETEY